jgi:HEAT repeat protein
VNQDNNRHEVTGRETRVALSVSDPNAVQLGGDAAVLHLVSQLDSPDLGIRYKALLALAALGDGRAYEHLISLMKQANSSFLCYRTAEALAVLGDQRAFEPLLEIVRTHERRLPYRVVASLNRLDAARTWRTFEGWAVSGSAIQRQTAIEALSLIDPLRAVPYLIAALKDTTVEVRRAAAELLEAHPHPDAIPALVDALADTGSFVSVMSIRALSKLNDPRVTDALLHHLLYGRIEDQAATARLISTIQDDRIVPRLLDALRELPADFNRMSHLVGVIEALGYLKTREATPVLLSLIDDNRMGSFITHPAHEALACIDPHLAFERIRPMLSDPDVEVRNEALYLLQYVRTEEAVSALIYAERHETDENIRGTIGIVLSQPFDAEPEQWQLGPLVDLLHHRNTRMRHFAAFSISCVATGQDIDILLIMVHHSDPMVRRCAVGAFERLKDPRGLALTKLLTDPDLLVRRNSAQALGVIGNPRAGAALIQALNDTEPIVRAYAAESLGMLRYVDAAPHLIRLLADQAHILESVPVSDYAALALEDLNTPDTLAAVQNYYAEHGPNSLYRIETKETSTS